MTEVEQPLHSQASHDAFDTQAEVPVSIVEKPDGFKPLDSADVDLARLGLQFENYRINMESNERNLTHAAETDPLTGVGNRRMFEFFSESLDKAGKPFRILLIDIDDFKAVNDNYGHQAGDDALIGVANLIRPRDNEIVIARLGGDEFAIIEETFKHPGRRSEDDSTPPKGIDRRKGADDRRDSDIEPAEAAKGAAARLDEALPALNDRLGEQYPGLHIGISVGAADHQPGDTVASTLDRADADMYAVKNGDAS